MVQVKLGDEDYASLKEKLSYSGEQDIIIQAWQLCMSQLGHD